MGNVDIARLGWLAAARYSKPHKVARGKPPRTSGGKSDASGGKGGREGGKPRAIRPCSTHCDVLASVPSNDTKLNSQPDPVSGPGMSIATLGSTSSSVMFRTAEIP